MASRLTEGPIKIRNEKRTVGSRSRTLQGERRPPLHRLGVVLIGSAITLLIKEQSPASVLVPAFLVAGTMIFGLLLFQAMLHRQHVAKAQPS